MQEIPEITGMRGYASLSVVIFHFFTLGLSIGIVPIASVVTSWNSGVDFFFVLSGFLLSVPFLHSGKSYSLKTYYLRRIFRILPVYYLNLIIVGTVLILTNQAIIQQLVAGLFFAQSFSPATFNSINGVNWTLVIEEIFYATLPLFSILFVKDRWKFSLPACLAVSLLYRFWVVQEFSHDNLAFHLWQYPSFVGHYAIGLTLANLYVNRKFFAGKFGSAEPILTPIILVLLTQFFVGSGWGIGNNVTAFPGILFAFEYGLLIYFTLSIPSASSLKQIFDNRFATFFGKISYSLYLWHLPIEVMLVHTGIPVLAWVALSLLVSVAVATASYRFVEKPFLKLRDRVLHVPPKAEKPVRILLPIHSS